MNLEGDATAIPSFVSGDRAPAIPADVLARNERIAEAIGAIELALQLAESLQWDAVYSDGTLRRWQLLQREAESMFSGLVSALPWDRRSELFRRLRGLDKEDAQRTGDGDAGSGLTVLDGDEFIFGFQPPSMLIEPILARGHVVAMTAHPNGGKSSIAVQLALVAAHLASLPGLDPDPKWARVLYLAGDSDTNFAMQLIAAVEQHDLEGEDLRDRLWIVPRRFSLIGQVEAIEALAKEFPTGFGLVVVDTRAAYSAAEQEDDNMQALADAIALRRLTRIEGGPAVLVLCHPSKQASRDQMTPRGGSAFLGEIDENLVLWNDGDGVVELTAQKRRIPDFEPIRWRFDVVDIDRQDNRGRPVRSVRACRVTDGQAAQTVAAKRQDEDRLMHAMLHHPNESQAEWARLCGWLIEGGQHTGQPHKTKVGRLLARLKADKLADVFRGVWRLTDAGRREAGKAE